MGFGIGTTDVLPSFMNTDPSYRVNCNTLSPNYHGWDFRNTTGDMISNCSETGDIIASMFLNSIYVGATTEPLGYRSTSRDKIADLQNEPVLRGTVTSLEPSLPLLGLVFLYIGLQLVSIVMQTKFEKYHSSTEMNLLAEVCGSTGIQNPLNISLPDRELFYSLTRNEINSELKDGHCGYLPAFIFKQIRRYEYCRSNEEGNQNSILRESDMETYASIDGCVAEDDGMKTVQRLSED